jgi:hypothetical protein
LCFALLLLHCHCAGVGCSRSVICLAQTETSSVTHVSSACALLRLACLCRDGVQPWPAGRHNLRRQLYRNALPLRLLPRYSPPPPPLFHFILTRPAHTHTAAVRTLYSIVCTAAIKKLNGNVDDGVCHLPPLAGVCSPIRDRLCAAARGENSDDSASCQVIQGPDPGSDPSTYTFNNGTYGTHHIILSCCTPPPPPPSPPTLTLRPPTLLTSLAYLLVR